jgi:hypothetical protein
MASWVGAGLILLLFGSGCAAASDQDNSERSKRRVLAAQARVTHKAFDPSRFTSSTVVDNKWFPLKPGSQLVYSGGVTDDGERLSHKVIFTVTDLTKVVDGVASVVVWDRDYTDGQLVEGELAFHAQDDSGNVWNMGEYPEEYENDSFAGAPDTWLAGVAGAQPGILMRAVARKGTPPYFQGIAPRIQFKDKARVQGFQHKHCVPFNCYRNVLVTSEWNPDEPGAFQRKFYAAGVGNIRVGWAGPKEKEREVLRLVAIRRLTPAQLGVVRRQALKLEHRAYNLPTYRKTQPAQRR